MYINDKIDSLTRDNAVAELTEIFKNQDVKVSINWLGQRVISVGGYQGSAKILKIAEKYFSSEIFSVYWDDKAAPSPQNRLQCYDLGSRVEQLVKDSDKALAKTWLYKYFVAFFEGIQFYFVERKSSDALFLHNPLPQDMLHFTVSEYRKYWGEKLPSTYMSLTTGGTKRVTLNVRQCIVLESELRELVKKHTDQNNLLEI